MLSQRLKIYFLAAIFGAIAIAMIGYFYTKKDLPPYPKIIQTVYGKTVSGKAAIMSGQQVWQRYGLMDLGSVWGHGTYRGPDFTAQALHNMGETMRQVMARKRFAKEYATLSTGERGAVDAVVIQQIKTNTYDKKSDTLTLSPLQVAALIKNRIFYTRLFIEGDEDGPINAGTISDSDQLKDLADFFFWTAWCASTIRPGDTHTYTNNWPHDPSVGNTVSGKSLVWSAISLVAFGLCLGVMIFLYHKHGFNKGALPFTPEPAAAMAAAPISPSQRKSAKFFLLVAALFFTQVNVGGLMAHYTVSPDSFYGLKTITEFIPYNWVKTWHLQLAIFWIAVSWIGMTLFVAPRVGNREPKGQGFLVDLLFIAVVVVATGSLAGEVLGIKGFLADYWFWLGHQGWEYLELGRLWQILLFVGLILWLFLVVRALRDHFRAGHDKWGLPNFLAYSGVAVVGFFSFGLTYDPQTHITIADFWRWWVVHTWVEGAFEFFAWPSSPVSSAWDTTTTGSESRHSGWP